VKQARKRLAARSLALARRTHEEERAERLTQFRLAFEEFEGMSDVEKGIARSYWETAETDTAKPKITKPVGSTQRATETSKSAKLNQAVSSSATASGLTAMLPVEEASEVIVKVASFIRTVSELVDSYRQSAKPYRSGPKETPEEVMEAIDHIRDLEVFEATLDEKPKLPEEEEDEDTSLIDEKIQEIVPTDYFTESPTQTALTTEEGKVIEAFLHPPEPLPLPLVSVPEVDSPDQPTPMEQLDAIISKSPEVKDIYARALSLPTISDHNDCKELLVKMGVPVMEAMAPYEAEGLASSLAKAGLVDFVGTEDSDVLAYEVSPESLYFQKA